MIRVPAIVPNSNWSAQAADSAAKIVSPIYVVPVSGRLTLTAVLPANNETIIFTAPFAQTYTFKTTPSTVYDVQIVTGNATACLENLIAAIQENETTVTAWVEGGIGIIKNNTAGLGNEVTAAAGTWGTVKTAYLGNNGAYEYRGQAISVSRNGAAAVVVTLPAYATPADLDKNVRDISDYIQTALAAAPTTLCVTSPVVAAASANASRIILNSNLTTAQETLEITAIAVGGGTGVSLFTVGDYAVGTTIAHPASDAAGDDKLVRLYHPADPVFFRNDNRPLIDLADNDKQIYKSLIALKDGYNAETGATYAASSEQTTFNAPNGITIKGQLVLNGGLLMNGAGITQINIANLNVSDRVIQANAGEALSGVDGGTGTPSGISINRGTWDNNGLLWYEKTGTATAAASQNAMQGDSTGATGGFWQIDGPIIGTANGGKVLHVGYADGTARYGTVVEYEQITIGDGTNTFGTFNASDIYTVLPTAIAALTSGGKIFIKRGSYTCSDNIAINTDGIHIEGEGARTLITFANNKGIKIGTAATGTVSECMLHKLKLKTATAGATTALLTLLYGTQLTASTALVSGVSYRVDAITLGDNFANVGLTISTASIGDIFVSSASAVPNSWSTTKITPVYTDRCIVEKVWFEGASGSTTNVDIDFHELHGHMVSNNISTTYYTNLP